MFASTDHLDAPLDQSPEAEQRSDKYVVHGAAGDRII